jgi:hypothetical protein
MRGESKPEASFTTTRRTFRRQGKARGTREFALVFLDIDGDYSSLTVQTDELWVKIRAVRSEFPSLASI